MSMNELKNRRCLAVLVREHWFLGVCRGQAACLYLELDDDSWVEIAPDKSGQCWTLSASDEKRARNVYGDGDSHYPIKDVGKIHKLNGQRIDSVNQQPLDGKIEICVEFANAADITMHYNLSTHESSFYLTRD